MKKQQKPKLRSMLGVSVNCFVRRLSTKQLRWPLIKSYTLIISFFFVKVVFGQSPEELLWLEDEAIAINIPYNGEEFISENIPFDLSELVDKEIYSSFKNSRIDVFVTALDKPVCFFVFGREITETSSPITSFVSTESNGLPLCPGLTILSNINSVTSVAILFFEKPETTPLCMSGNLDSLKYPTAIASEPMSGFCFAIFNGDTLKSFMAVLSIMNWTKSNLE